MAPRIIAFGCSYTSYVWPTYASILKADNQGWPGTGNDRIFYNLLQAYKSKKLQEYDIVIVQWSGHNRFDYLTNHGWTEPDGAIMLSAKNRHIWRNLKSYYNENYELEKTINYVIAADAILNQLPVKKFFMSMNHLKTKLIDYNNLLARYKGDYEFTSGAKWTKESFVDFHPTLIQHLDLANEIANKFNFTIDNDVIANCDTIHQKILNNKNFNECLSYTL